MGGREQGARTALRHGDGGSASSGGGAKGEVSARVCTGSVVIMEWDGSGPWALDVRRAGVDGR
jgi:hypothetical protein